MAKEYDILCRNDFDDFCNKIMRFIVDTEKQGAKFRKLKFTVKTWRKSKTPPQHRFYWVVINEMKKAFTEAGYEFHKDEIHEFVKNAHGFVKTVQMPDGSIIKVTKSIADNSDDAHVKAMMDLIDFAIRWTSINLNYVIEDPR